MDPGRGLQITISSSVTGELQSPQTLGMTSSQIGLIASVYLIGEMVGALVFGRQSDRLGRKRLLVFTLLLYLVGTGAAASTLLPEHRRGEPVADGHRERVAGRGPHRRTPGLIA